MQKILIAGIGGSGKTTLARRLAAVLGLQLHELDNLYYGPELAMSPTFPADVERIAQQDRWIFDSGGPPGESEAPPRIRDLLWSRADTLIWLDYPRRFVVFRAARRSVRRIVLREELWHGHRETPHWCVRPHHPIRRAWRLSRHKHEELAARTQQPRFRHLTVIQFTRPRQTTNWLRDLASTTSQ